MRSREDRLLRKLRIEVAKRGYNVILVQQDMVAPVCAFIWERKVERYRSKYESREGSTSLREWQGSMLNKTTPRAPGAKWTYRWRRVLSMP